jgi:hypothetical protein
MLILKGVVLNWAWYQISHCIKNDPNSNSDVLMIIKSTIGTLPWPNSNSYLVGKTMGLKSFDVHECSTERGGGPCQCVCWLRRPPPNQERGASTKSREGERLEMCRYCISASPHTEQDLHFRSLPRDLCRTIPMLLPGTYVSWRCTAMGVPAMGVDKLSTSLHLGKRNVPCRKDKQERDGGVARLGESR